VRQGFFPAKLYTIHSFVEPHLKEIKMNDLLTVAEVAIILRVDDTTVRRWVKQGALEAIVLPHVNERQAYRVRRSTLEQLIGSPIKLEAIESK
jgi:excisionase family DNA binding protein